MDIKIFLLSNKTSFSIFLDECLKEDAFETNFIDRIKQEETLQDNIVIINLLEKRVNIDKELDFILHSKCQKIILLENAMNLYLNSKNQPPFSVYTKLQPENEISIKFLEIENKIINSEKQYVIFRITDIYGPSIPEALVNQLFRSKKRQLQNTKHDFIYEGDVIQAIEIALGQNVIGLFDIASGQTISLRTISELITKSYNINSKINWKRKKQKISFNCENLKFFGWQPLINIEMGLSTIFSLKKH